MVIPVLAFAVIFVHREHKVGDPTLDGLGRDITRDACIVGAGVADVLVLDFYRVVVLEAAELLVVGAIAVVDGRRWVVDQSLAIDVGVAVVGVLVTAIERVEVDLDDVVEEELGHVELHLEVVGVRTAHDTEFVREGDVGRIGVALATAVDAERMVVHRTCLAGDSLEPVGFVAFVREVGATVDDVVGIHEVGGLVPVAERYISVVGDFGLLLTMTCLGGDDDDTVGTTGTVDGGCRGILQHIDRSDVFGSNGRKRTFNAIDENERGDVTMDGGDTAEHDA